jgi:hypothetical protein
MSALSMRAVGSAAVEDPRSLFLDRESKDFTDRKGERGGASVRSVPESRSHAASSICISASEHSCSAVRITPQISLGSDSPQVTQALNTLIVPRICQVIDQILINPDLLKVAALHEHPYVHEIKEACNAFNQKFPVEKVQLKSVLEAFSLLHIDQIDGVEDRDKVKNTVSSVLFTAIVLMGGGAKKKDESCIIC